MRKTEPVTWNTWKPLDGEFPCVRCAERNAVVVVELQGFRLPVCALCEGLPDGELIEPFIRKEGRQ